MNREEGTIAREAGSQGKHWTTVHGGYFADPQVARPLVDAAAEAIARRPPTVVADLGGGTGFILGELLKRQDCDGLRLVNVDLSARQLAECCDPRICDLQRSVTTVSRADLLPDGGSLMFVMRSVLHYLGFDGTRRLLRHLRGQMQPGEFFVHQTGCFWLGPQRTCFNLLYQRMQTGKWYPLVGELEYLVAREGWEVVAVAPAPPLRLDSASLAERYRLTPKQVAAIRDELAEQYGDLKSVFCPEPDGFTAWLHYHVLTCQAI